MFVRNLHFAVLFLFTVSRFSFMKRQELVRLCGENLSPRQYYAGDVFYAVNDLCCWYTWQVSSECFKCVLVFNWFLNWLLHELMHVLLHSCNDLRHNWTHKRFRWWFVRALYNTFHSLTSVIVSHLVLIFSDAWLPFNPQANYSINDTDQSLVPGLIISSDFLRKRKGIQFFFG